MDPAADNRAAGHVVPACGCAVEHLGLRSCKASDDQRRHADRSTLRAEGADCWVEREHAIRRHGTRQHCDARRAQGNLAVGRSCPSACL